MMLSVVFLVFATIQSSADPEALAAFERFETRVGRLESVQFEFRKLERMRNGKVVRERLIVKKWKTSRLYIAALEPHKGREILFDAKRNPDEFLVHKGSFPDMTISIDILGHLALHDQHHPITHVGFEYVAANLRKSVKSAKLGDRGDQLRYLGLATIDDVVCEHVRFEAGKVRWKSTVAREDETVFDLQTRFGIDAYVIYYASPSIDDLRDELDAGKNYPIPVYYGKYEDMWFDRTTHLLRRLQIRDFKNRLYEQYDYVNVVGNEITEHDFDKDNPKYDF